MTLADLMRQDRERATIRMQECPECFVGSPIAEWRATEIGCEDCGEHPAVVCPDCGAVIDTIFRKLLSADDLRA